MEIPLVMAAFGASTGALETYEKINDFFLGKSGRKRVYWAFTSRIIRKHLKSTKNIEVRSLAEVLGELEKEGHKWAVVQSLYLMWGHEFSRLVEDSSKGNIRVSMGLPLLTSPHDYLELVRILGKLIPRDENQAVVFLGHGTDHPAWSSYTALFFMLRQKYGKKVWVGVVEEGYPEKDEIVNEVSLAGFSSVMLIPLLLVAGGHFAHDIMGRENSWKSAFEEKGIKVTARREGLGGLDGVMENFYRHAVEAKDSVII